MHSFNRPIATAVVSLVLILAVAGCGSTAATSTTSTSPGVRFNGKASSIPLESQFTGSAIPASYTCDGRDKLPPLNWGPVPAATKQLALFILGFTRAGQSTKIKLLYALGGLKPTLRSIQAGRLPPGAIPGRNSAGHTKYSLCPARGATENFVFLLYAIPNQLHLRSRFDGAKVLGQLSPSSSTATFGAFVAAYARR